jgi:hypothetical protein
LHIALQRLAGADDVERRFSASGALNRKRAAGFDSFGQSHVSALGNSQLHCGEGHGADGACESDSHSWPPEL